MIVLGTLAAAEPLRFDVRHVSPARRMMGKTRMGTVSFGEEGMSFRETGKSKKPLPLDVPYREMQQVTLGVDSVCIRLYRDRSVWKLGADEVYCFDRPKAGDFRALDGWLKGRLGERLASAVPRKAEDALWEMQVKHHRAMQGSQGVLRAGKDWMSYTTEAKDDSRFWRFDDIENISSTSPFELQITVYERSRYHHGGWRSFRFQLKDRMSEERYQQLWKALEQGRQANILDSYSRKGN